MPSGSMQNVTAVVGWALYILLAVYVVADLVNIVKAAWRQRTIRVSIDVGLFTFGVGWITAVAVLIAFGVTDWPKLHLL